MEFVQEPLTIGLADGGSKHLSFTAELHDRRPPFEEIESYRAWGHKLREELLVIMSKRVCPVQWVSIFVDEEGVFLLATAKTEVVVGNFKQGLGTVLRSLPKEHQRAVERTLRPIDELDRDRVAAWTIASSLCPRAPRARPAQEDVRVFFAGKEQAVGQQAALENHTEDAQPPALTPPWRPWSELRAGALRHLNEPHLAKMVMTCEDYYARWGLERR